MENRQNQLILKAQNLGRIYKSYTKKPGIIASIKGFWSREHVEKRALYKVNLEVYKGDIIGLVGSNGAGKTTLLKLLAGLIHPTEGDLKVLGYEPSKRNHDYLKKMSLLLGQKNQLWWDISPFDSYRMLMKIYNLDHKKAQNHVEELSSILNCQNILNTQLRRLSLGERMKAEIIGALLHQPEILFLDEPTIGLDIVAQTSIRQFLKNYVERYKPVVFLTSHYMDDITSLAQRLLLISKGQLVYDGTVEAFEKKHFIESKILYKVKGELEYKIKSIDKSFLTEELTQILKQNEVEDIRIEEVDFEEIIHKFLQKESGSV